MNEISSGGASIWGTQACVQLSPPRMFSSQIDYSALIQNRKSVREFAGKKVPAAALAEIEAYYRKSCQRLIPELETKLCVFGADAAKLQLPEGYEAVASCKV